MKVKKLLIAFEQYYFPLQKFKEKKLTVVYFFPIKKYVQVILKKCFREKKVIQFKGYLNFLT